MAVFTTPQNNNYSSGYALGGVAGTILSDGPTVALLNSSLVFKHVVQDVNSAYIVQKGDACYFGGGALKVHGIAEQSALLASEYISIKVSGRVIVATLTVLGITASAADGALAYGATVYQQTGGTLDNNSNASGAVAVGILLGAVTSHATHASGDQVPVLML